MILKRLQTTARTHKRLIAATAIAAGAIIIAIASLTGGGRKDAEENVAVFTAAKGPLTISVTESGTIKPREREIIKNEIEGRTTILYLIPEGTRVKKGDLLVELDATSLVDEKIEQEIRVQNAEAAFIQSRENLAVVRNQATSDVDKAELDLRFSREDVTQYKEGEFPNTLKEHEAQITLAREELQRAEETLKWSRRLFKEKYIAESELQADELAVNKAKLDLELAENNLVLLKDYTEKRKMDELQSNSKQAEMTLQRVRRKAAADVVQANADLRAKESEFKRQSDRLQKLEEQIAKARIYAPRDGLVVYATSAEFSWRGNTEPLDEGQEVRERQELIHLPTASTFLAEVKVHESNLDKITTGLPVRIRVDALPDREFSGTVSKIAPLADPMSMFMNPDLKVYNTQIDIDGGGDVLRTGMSCEAEIIVEHFDSALYVPVQCIVRVNGETTAFVKTHDGIEQRSVQIGMDNNRMVRILGGLQEGEAVLLAPPLDLEPSGPERSSRRFETPRESSSTAASSEQEERSVQPSRIESDSSSERPRKGSHPGRRASSGAGDAPQGAHRPQNSSPQDRQ